MSPGPGGDPEERWLREVYKPDATNLTVRAVLLGMLLGGVMCLSNLYVFFKTGWSIGVTITACILGFALLKALHKAGLTKTPLGVLENNAMTTVASGAGYMTGGGNMAAFGALLMVTSTAYNPWAMVLWFGVIAAMGVFVAIPIKRQLINREALAFPTGTATAATIESIHSEAPSQGISKATLLLYFGLFGAFLCTVRDIFKLIPDALAPGLLLVGKPLVEWGISLKMEVILLGAGGLMSLRTGWSLIVGAIITYFFIAPPVVDAGLVESVKYKHVVLWTLWPGAAILVGAGITSFLLDWRSLKRAMSGIGVVMMPIARLIRGKAGQGRGADGPNVVPTAISEVEVPTWWFPAGFAALSPIVIFLMWALFDIPAWAGVVAMFLSIVMGFIAARVTGETDTTPTKALGPVTQAAFGVMVPGNISANIMSANVTGGIGLHAADLLTTMKTGWLLGAKPRHQVYAQLLGVIAGAIVVVPAFQLIIPDPSLFGTTEWPAPSCMVWAGVSKAFTQGLGGLGEEARIAIMIGLVIGVGLSIIEKMAKPNLRRFIPSPAGLGLAMVIPFANSLSMFIGSVIAVIMVKRGREAWVLPAAAGLIAGESLMGIIAQALKVSGIL